MNTVLITGANRGIGLEFCKQYAQSGWNVIATCRVPYHADQLNNIAEQNNRIRVVAMDVTDHETVDQLASSLADESCDLLIANAGMYGDSRGNAFGNLDYSVWRTTLETNVLGVVKVVEAFTPHLKRSKQPLIAALSSMMGSIADNTSGGSLLYRSSKAALNAALKSLSIDLFSTGIGVLIFHPGWVKTDMGGPNALVSAETSVTGMIERISSFDISQSGLFMKYDGTLVPW